MVNSKPRPLRPQETPVPIAKEAGCVPGSVGTGTENLDPTGVRSPDSPARSESLYRLNYHGSYSLGAVFINKLLLAPRINVGNGLLIHEV